MIRPEHCLKPAWARRHLESAWPLLPAGSHVALHVGDTLVAALGEPPVPRGEIPVISIPLQLEGRQVGLLRLHVPSGIDQAKAWGDFIIHGLQGVLAAEHGRRAVARETLETYREMALLQRAVAELNQSLDPAAVLAALLKEFEGRTADYGAVFLFDVESECMRLGQTFGVNAADAFTALQESPLFGDIAGRDTGDILNDLASSALWAGEPREFLSLLWLPLLVRSERLGVLLLASRRSEGFSAADLKRAQTLSSVAATALRNAQTYAAEQRLFQSFVKVIATTIDAKSPYTAGHCRRVPEIALMLAQSAHKAQSGPFADFVLDEETRHCIEIAATLHDCGKIVTPEWIVGKSRKLDRIEDGFQLVNLRFEVMLRDAAIARDRALAAGGDPFMVERSYRERLGQLGEDLYFLEKCNGGTDVLSDEHVARIQAIARERWTNHQGEQRPLLTEQEVYNLSVRRGTLNAEERRIIEDHVVHTINMLSQIAFPRSLRHVTAYAGGHHERMNGTGYPYGLTGDQLPLPARMIALADIFEALTAPDRPYRSPGALNWALEVMRRMAREQHIDADLFDLFIAEEIHLAYARVHLPDGGA
jgi:HD-GYP domain-containing protein (c-di-GMP phosphodiesterase class II)